MDVSPGNSAGQLLVHLSLSVSPNLSPSSTSLHTIKVWFWGVEKSGDTMLQAASVTQRVRRSQNFLAIQCRFRNPSTTTKNKSSRISRGTSSTCRGGNDVIAATSDSVALSCCMITSSAALVSASDTRKSQTKGVHKPLSTWSPWWMCRCQLQKATTVKKRIHWKHAPVNYTLCGLRTMRIQKLTQPWQIDCLKCHVASDVLQMFAARRRCRLQTAKNSFMWWQGSRKRRLGTLVRLNTSFRVWHPYSCQPPSALPVRRQWWFDQVTRSRRCLVEILQVVANTQHLLCLSTSWPKGTAHSRSSNTKNVRGAGLLKTKHKNVRALVARRTRAPWRTARETWIAESSWRGDSSRPPAPDSLASESATCLAWVLLSRFPGFRDGMPLNRKVELGRFRTRSIAARLDSAANKGAGQNGKRWPLVRQGPN